MALCVGDIDIINDIIACRANLFRPQLTAVVTHLGDPSISTSEAAESEALQRSPRVLARGKPLLLAFRPEMPSTRNVTPITLSSTFLPCQATTFCSYPSLNMVLDGAISPPSKDGVAKTLLRLSGVDFHRHRHVAPVPAELKRPGCMRRPRACDNQRASISGKSVSLLSYARWRIRVPRPLRAPAHAVVASLRTHSCCAPVEGGLRAIRGNLYGRRLPMQTRYWLAGDAIV
mmetsp:Transcript_87524/g.160097  ORF Transcript_87524/g.160097 Transcript_87524/m.160097 type:complete len:231 (-) Transcript_87524:284-976(-)